MSFQTICCINYAWEMEKHITRCESVIEVRLSKKRIISANKKMFTSY